MSETTDRDLTVDPPIRYYRVDAERFLVHVQAPEGEPLNPEEVSNAARLAAEGWNRAEQQETSA